MIILFQIIVLTSIWVLGWTIVTQQGMLLYSIREWAEGQGSKILEPVILCHWCMPSLHSVFGYIFAFSLGLLPPDPAMLFIYPLVVMGSSLCCGMIWTLYQYLSAKTEFYNKMNNEKID
jgi:hypothetical protein